MSKKKVMYFVGRGKDKEVTLEKQGTEGAIQELYDILECRTFGIVSRKIGEVYYDIYHDDEFLMRDVKDQYVTAVEGGFREKLLGNILISKHDGKGKSVSLSFYDIKVIKENMIQFIDIENASLNNVVRYSI